MMLRMLSLLGQSRAAPGCRVLLGSYENAFVADSLSARLCHMADGVNRQWETFADCLVPSDPPLFIAWRSSSRLRPSTGHLESLVDSLNHFLILQRQLPLHMSSALDMMALSDFDAASSVHPVCAHATVSRP